MKTTAQGFSLIEMIVVVALISLFAIPILVGISRTGQTQNIRTSVSVLSDDLQTVKVSAREARDKAGWGIVTTSASTYEIVKGTPISKVTVNQRSLESGITFVNQFSIWFTIGTGGVTPPQQIQIINKNGQKYEILVNELGTISVSAI